MGGKKTMEHIAEVCRRLDARIGPQTLRKAALIAAFPVAALTPTCMAYGAPAYGVPFPDEEIDCSDGFDNDDDGLTDCADDDCATEDESCLGCDDGIDNEGDGVADCDDPDCAGLEVCL